MENLRNLQLKELAILIEVDRVCKLLGINYYLSSGTAIGAIRHEGFIPWDDDIDIMMPISDYKRFLQLAPSALAEHYFLQNYETDPHDHTCFSKIRLSNTAMIMPNHIQWKVNQGVWIDVFPLITVTGEADVRKRQRLIAIANYLQMDSWVLGNEKEFRQILGVLYYPWRLFLKTPVSLRIAIHSMLLKHAFADKGGDYCCEVFANIQYINPMDILEGSPRYLVFEDVEFPVVSKIEEYLRIQYGDYMTLPPEDKRVNHGKLITDFNRSYIDVLKDLSRNNA